MQARAITGEPTASPRVHKRKTNLELYVVAMLLQAEFFSETHTTPAAQRESSKNNAVLCGWMPPAARVSHQ